MKRPLRAKILSGILGAAGACLVAPAVLAQTHPEIEPLAARTAARAAKSHPQHILVAGLADCQLQMDLCTAFEDSLRGNLEKLVPGAHFVKRESVVNILEGRGFLALDAYFPDVLKAAANSAGADILVTDSLLWEADGYELTSEVEDVAQDKKLDQFRAKIPLSLPDSSGEPFVFTDPESKISLLIPRGKASPTSPVQFPVCQKCPDARFTPEARASGIHGRVLLLGTVTEQGSIESIGVVDGLEYGLTDEAMQAVQTWRFKPATGKDGKPLATRIPIEVNFRLR